MPGKPARMHRCTYERLVAELLTERRRRDALWGAACEELLRRTDALLARPEYAEYLRD